MIRIPIGNLMSIFAFLLINSCVCDALLLTIIANVAVGDGGVDVPADLGEDLLDTALGFYL